MFKKKNQKELTPEQLKVKMFRQRFEALRSDRNQKKIDDARFIREMRILEEEVSKMERELNGFDEMMGRPIEWLDDIFDSVVHKAIDEVDRDIQN